MSVATVTNSNKLALHGQTGSNGQQKPQPRKRFTNDYSISLSKEENEYLFTLLGDRCITLATAVIQLFLSEQPNHTRWRKKLTGVVCFVKDNNRRNYFIRVYDLDHSQSCVWQQELYFTFQYRCPRPYFHTFEADTSMAALNFATDKEAGNFRRVVLEKVNTMNQKQQEKKKAQQRLNSLNQPNNNFSVPSIGNLSIGNNSYLSSNVSTKERKKKDKKDKKDKKKYCKEDIGLPTNFKHLHHVGWNSVGVDSQIMQVLKEAGISQNQYENPKNKQFIDQFVQDYKAKEDHGQSSESEFSMGGYSTNYNGYPQQLPSQQRYNQKVSGPPPLPQSQPSYTYNSPANYSTAYQHQSNGRNMDHSMNSLNMSNMSNNINSQPLQPYVTKPAPPIPSNNLVNIGHKSTAAPKPPPLPTNLNNNQMNNNSSMNKISPDSSKDIPPPPPLPPPLPQQPVISNSAPPPKPPPPQMNNTQPPDTRSALLDQIRQGRNLKKVEKTVQLANTNSNQGSGDTRDALLDQIRRGVELKSVNTNAEKPAPSLNTSGLAGALAKALQERSRALQQTDESSSDSSDLDDEEWSD